MAEGTEPIRQDIKTIRDSMAETLDQIEHRVRENVDDKVEQARQSVNWRHWVEARPLGVVGVAIALGFLMGRRKNK